MIIIWIIGLILCLAVIWFLKNCRTSYYGAPVLKMWILLLLIISSVIPVASILIGFVVGLWFLLDPEVVFIGIDNKFIKFLNKPIK